jgi:hypothetical protein
MMKFLSSQKSGESLQLASQQKRPWWVEITNPSLQIRPIFADNFNFGQFISESSLSGSSSSSKRRDAASSSSSREPSSSSSKRRKQTIGMGLPEFNLPVFEEEYKQPSSSSSSFQAPQLDEDQIVQDELKRAMELSLQEQQEPVIINPKAAAPNQDYYSDEQKDEIDILESLQELMGPQQQTQQRLQPPLRIASAPIPPQPVTSLTSIPERKQEQEREEEEALESLQEIMNRAQPQSQPILSEEEQELQRAIELSLQQQEQVNEEEIQEINRELFENLFK